MKLTRVTELDVFNGWDAGDNIRDVVLVNEFKHAWKDHFKKFSCPLTLSPTTLHPARDFCQRVGIPFRFFVRWSIQILEQFPQPWELNLKWLQSEVELIWLEVKDTYVPELQDPYKEAQNILKDKT